MAYFSNKEFDKLFLTWKSVDTDAVTKRGVETKMANMIRAMVVNYVRHPSFARYPEAFRDDLVQEGTIQVWLKVGGFNREVGTNYFSYFTTVAKNAFVGQLRDYYKNKNRNIPLDVIENFIAEEEK